MSAFIITLFSLYYFIIPKLREHSAQSAQIKKISKIYLGKNSKIYRILMWSFRTLQWQESLAQDPWPNPSGQIEGPSVYPWPNPSGQIEGPSVFESSWPSVYLLSKNICGLAVISNSYQAEPECKLTSLAIKVALLAKS